MKFTLSQIRDTEEPPEQEEDDTTAEAHHQEMLRTKHDDYASFLWQAEQALRCAPAITWDEFVKMWG